MKKVTKTAIRIAAKQHAISILGVEQYDKNKEAARALRNDFTAGVEWALKQDHAVHPTDQGHDLITKERLGHFDRGYDAAHDDQYTGEQLVTTGILLAADGTELEGLLKDVPWPIAGYPDKRGKLDRVNELSKAGSFLSAGIDQEIRKVS